MPKGNGGLSRGQRWLEDIRATALYGPIVLTCPKTAARLRRAETQGVTQRELNEWCDRNCSLGPCRFGCTRSERYRLRYEGRLRYGPPR